MSDPPPSECQKCGASPVAKVLYPAAVHFKGSGFYSTEYGRGGRKRAASGDGDVPSTETKPSKEKKTEKPETKPAEA
jgi:predicted nucleic acid-binding Zn ribbon protein